MKQFVKSTDLEVKNGGYLTANGNPVGHPEFVKAQQAAEYVVKFAELAKGKNFKSVKVDSLADLRSEVMAALSQKSIQFVAAPTPVERPLTQQLTAEAMAFIGFQDNVQTTSKVNEFMQQFAVLHDFEQNGLYFDQEIVRLTKIYTVKEITDAVMSCIELL